MHDKQISFCYESQNKQRSFRQLTALSAQPLGQRRGRLCLCFDRNPLQLSADTKETGPTIMDSVIGTSIVAALWPFLWVFATALVLWVIRRFLPRLEWWANAPLGAVIARLGTAATSALRSVLRHGR